MRKKNRLYTIFNSMHCRCERPQTHGYNRYGGRGIRVCDEWRYFAPFREWALANGYSEDLTLDRIDNDKGYSPENCRWATREEQVNHQRTNRNITCNGETKTLAQWAKISGNSRSVIDSHLKKGMPPEIAIFMPAQTTEKPLIAINPNTKQVYYFKSGKEAERCGHKRAAIWRAITGEYKTHHGLIWSYAK